MMNVFFAVFLAFFYSIVNTVIGPMIAEQDIKFDWSQLFSFVLCFLLCLVVNFILFSIMPRLYLCTGSRRISQYLDKVGDRTLFLFVWLFIFVSWVPAYLILYPGVLAYDMVSQVGSALGEITNNHHPVLHTWLIRCFMKFGSALFSSYEAGIGLLSVLQMLILSYALTRLAFLLKKKNVPILIVMLTALFSAIWFMNACLSVTMIKDSLHAAFLVLFACHFTEIVTNPLEYFRRRYNLFILPVISFLMCAFRNNGIHIYIFCFAVLFILRISQIKKIKAHIAQIVVILLPIFLYKIYTGPVFSAFDIDQGEVREALSVPIQQLQRVAVKKADELTNEQTELMAYYIDNLEWMESSPGRIYSPFIADPAKSCFYSNSYNNDPIAFWKFYFQIGEQFSKEYIVAFLSNSLGYWYPGYYAFSYVEYENYSPDMFAEPLERKSIWDSQILKKYYESVCTSSFWRKTPVLRLFFVPGFTLWFLLYGLALAWKKRGFFTETLPLFLPLIAQYGIMILSPMSSFRYSWPFYLMLPLAFIGIFENLELKKSEKAPKRAGG
ncbi:MAG: DUF6020 family protein [Firmicutes bacterium]|nr:DUF6020 family protein [Bacillota bacterium]